MRLSRARTAPSSRCASSGRVTAALLLSFLAFAPSATAQVDSDQNNRGQDPIHDSIVLPPGPHLPFDPDRLPPPPAEHTFTLRHLYHHGTYLYPELHRVTNVEQQQDSRVWLAAEDGYRKQDITRLKAWGRTTSIERMVDRRPSVVDPLVAKARKQGYAAVFDSSAWRVDEVSGPDATDKETVMSMAHMAADAYVESEDDTKWLDVGLPFNRSNDFGWESDGLRGHIWADENNSTIVIGLKGTSPAVFDGEGTTSNDKINDNLFFSCCCAQQGQWTWHQVCDCATDTYSCNNTCVVEALHDEHRYYSAARELYSNVTELYPKSTIWLTGHSLGGAVASLLGLTYGLPVITFEAVPEALAAARLGLPVPPGADPSSPQTRRNTGTFHFGHTADPIYIGTCNGVSASCSFAGYALETACHTGQECVYDVVADKGWRVGIGTHKIRAVISDVLEAYDDVPECSYNPECRDCAQWKMYESNGTDSTTTVIPSSTSFIRTRTSTCETPGWWGCLDKTTTTEGEASTTSSTSSSSTCETPGWFGCNDKTTTTTTVASTSSSPTPPPSTTCETPGRFWGCRDEPTPTEASPSAGASPVTTSPPTSIPHPTVTVPKSSRCLRRNWLGFCKQWEGPDPDDYNPDEI